VPAEVISSLVTSGTSRRTAVAVMRQSDGSGKGMASTEGRGSPAGTIRGLTVRCSWRGSYQGASFSPRWVALLVGAGFSRGYLGDGLPRRSRRATWGSWSEAWSANSALTCTGS
jgi:hypothetical protein